MSFLLFCTLFLLLFFFSQKCTRLLSRLFQHIFKKTAITINLLSFLFLPGIILHELSHFLIASILFVPTGEIEFFPEVHGNQVKMGSVAIALTDPFRRFLIGVAPVIIGIGIMFAASSYISASLFSIQNLLLFYVIFQISNTMFSSSKDMEGALGLTVGITLIGIVLQLFGIPVWVTIFHIFTNSPLVDFFARINFFLLVALGIDIFLVLLFEGISRLHES